LSLPRYRQQEVKGRLDALWQAVAEQLPPADRKALGEFHVGALGFNDPNAWALTNWREKTINLTLEINREEVWLNLVGWQVALAQKLLRWLKTQASAQQLVKLDGYELVCYRRRARNWPPSSESARPWWQRDTFEEAHRYPAPNVQKRLGELLAWVATLDEPWEKPGFHLRKTWTREQAVAAGRKLVTEIAPQASQLVPLMREINAA
jgi:hypothetical protein